MGWHPIHCVAGAVSGLAALAAVGNALYLSSDIGAEGWLPGALALCLVAAGYLLTTAVDHMRRGRWTISPPRAEPWLSILILVLGWFVLARGPSSRLLLAGLGPTIAALSAAAAVSLLVHLRERLVLGRLAAISAGAWPLGAWRCALAAAVLLGVMIFESRPLPAVKPWESSESVAPKAKL